MKMKRFLGCLLSAALLLSSVYLVYADGYVYNSYDFETFTNSNDGMPSGITKGGYIASSTDDAHSGNALRFQTASSYIAVSITSLNASEQDKILLSSDVKITNAATSAKLFGGTTSSGGTAGGTYISLTADGRIVVCERDPAEKEWDLAPYSINTWYNIAVLIDKTAQKADIFLDGILIGDDIDWIWSGYSWLLMRPFTSGGNYTLWLDNLTYTDDPQYFPSPIYQLFDFDDFVKLSSPDNTKYTVNGNSLTRDSGYMAASTRDAGKCLAFQTASSSLLIYPLPEGFNAAKGKLLLSTDVMIKNDAASAALFGFATNSNLNSHIEFTADNKITVGGSEIGTYTNNRWYNIAVLIDKVAQKADVFLDGKLIGSDITWTWSSSYDRGRIKPLSSGENYDVRIDNLSYTNNPVYFPTYLKSVSIGGGLSAGSNTVTAVVSNGAVSEQPAVMILGLYDDASGDYRFVNATSENTVIKRNSDTTVSATISVPSAEGYAVRAFMWDSWENRMPIFDFTEFAD